MKVLVLMGGVSAERDVSLETGRAICNALEARGHAVHAIDTGAGAKLPASFASSHDKLVHPSPPDLQVMASMDRQMTLKSVSAADLAQIEVVFLALHGGAGENGTVQALLELTGRPYTGSGVLASALAMDKDITKRIFRDEGIPTPDWMMIEDSDLIDVRSLLDRVGRRFGYPVIIKPADSGSTIGLTLVKSRGQVEEAIKAARAVSKSVMIEEYIKGRELTVAVLNGEALPVVEIKPKNELYDYECKYTKGMSEYIAPADIPAEWAAALSVYGEKAFRALKCEGYARVDFLVESDGSPYCLEVNTLPGMTSLSLVPMAARAAGISFEDLVEKICRLAIEQRKS